MLASLSFFACARRCVRSVAQCFVFILVVQTICGASLHGKKIPSGADPSFAYDQVFTLENTRVYFVSSPSASINNIIDPSFNNNAVKIAEIIVYLPPDEDQVYRGIAMGWPNNRYRYTHIGSLYNFASIEFSWGWQNRVDNETDTQYVANLLNAIGTFSGHPEFGSIPFSINPRQGAERGFIGKFFDSMPERILSVNFGFADDRQTRNFSNSGIPVGKMTEVRREFSKFRNNFIERLNFQEGSLLVGGGEVGWSSHGDTLSKPMFGVLLLHAAFNARLKFTTPDAEGIRTPIPMTQEHGWLGAAVDPLKGGDREVARIGEFSGNLDRSAYLPDADFAYAWRAYHNPHPQLQVTAPATARGHGGQYAGNMEKRSPGVYTITWETNKPRLSANTPNLIRIDEELQAGIVESTIFIGAREIATLPGSSGAYDFDFGPGLHPIMIRARLADGSFNWSWPAVFPVGGDVYANRIPVLMKPNVSAPKNQEFIADLSAWVYDEDHAVGELDLALTGTPSHGSAQLSGRILTYTPEPEFTGEVSIDWSVADPFGTENFTTIINVQDAPEVNASGLRSGNENSTTRTLFVEAQQPGDPDQALEYFWQVVDWPEDQLPPTFEGRSYKTTTSEIDTIFYTSGPHTFRVTIMNTFGVQTEHTFTVNIQPKEKYLHIITELPQS